MIKSRDFAVVAGALAIGVVTTIAAQAAVTEVGGAVGGGNVPWALLSGGKPTP